MSVRQEATVIHLSDLHIRSEREADNSGGLSAAGLKTQNLIAHINNAYPGAHVVITGDITDSGTPTSQQEAQRILQDWMNPRRLSVVLGNHDCGLKGNFYDPACVQRFQKIFSPTVEGGLTFPWAKYIPPLSLIGLNSNVNTWNEWFAEGRLGGEQLGWMDQTLSKLPRAWIPVVLLHHHPFDSGLGTCLNDAADFRACIGRRLRDRPSLVLSRPYARLDQTPAKRCYLLSSPLFRDRQPGSPALSGSNGALRRHLRSVGLLPCSQMLNFHVFRKGTRSALPAVPPNGRGYRAIRIAGRCYPVQSPIPLPNCGTSCSPVARFSVPPVDNFATTLPRTPPLRGSQRNSVAKARDCNSA